MSVDPEAVRSVIRQRRETAEAAHRESPSPWLDTESRIPDLNPRFGIYDSSLQVARVADLYKPEATSHIAANDPAAVIALCDGALALVAYAVAVRNGSSPSAGEDLLHVLARMFGVSQEGTSDRDV